jgi:glucose-1-phosphate thymidylyltransferase
VRVIEKRQDTKIGCIEEIAYRMGFIGKEDLLEISSLLNKSGYGSYLKNLLREP